MSATTVPLAQFAQQLALAGAGSDISYWAATVPAGGTQRTLASVFSDAPFIEWFGQCGLGNDDTGVFTKAVQSGIPFRLGPKTYIVNGSWSTQSAPFFLVRGYTGLSRLLRMEGGATGAWIGLECAIVDVEGVIFDCNAPSVVANTWNVLVDTPVTLARFSACAFRNNSGTLGRGLAIIGAPAAPGGTAYSVDTCEFSGNASDGLGIFQASGVSITGCRAFNNGGSGIGVSVFSIPSSTNINQTALIQGNRCWNNTLDGINLGTINPESASPPFYTLAQPSLTTVSVLDNIIWANGSYGIQSYGDYLDVSGNQITQVATASGGLVATARYSRISRNTLNVPGVYIGIDSGGCYDCDICDNSVTGATIGINPGGSQLVTVRGNKLRGCSIGMSIYDIEADGNGVPFPAPVFGLTIQHNLIVIAAGGTGISVLDGGAGIAVLDNNFLSTDNTVSPSQALALRSAGTFLRGNLWNGTDRVDLNPDAQGVLEIPDVFDTVRVPLGGQVIDSVLPASVATSGGQVSFLTVTSGGSGYTQATVSIVGAGAGAQAKAMIYGGQVIGFRVTNNGAGYTAVGTICAITGDGSGATATVVVGNPIQFNRRLQVLATAGVTLRQVGQLMTQANATQRDLILVDDTALELVETGGVWIATGFYPAALLQSQSNGSVTLASPSGASLFLAPGSGANLFAVDLPSAATGLTTGAIWRNGNVLNIV